MGVHSCESWTSKNRTTTPHPLLFPLSTNVERGIQGERLNPTKISTQPSSQLTSGKRCKYASETEGRKDDKCRFRTGQKELIVFGRNLCPSHVYRKDQHGDAHAEHLPGQPHRSHRGRGYSIGSLLNGAHDGIGVGGRKKG